MRVVGCDQSLTHTALVEIRNGEIFSTPVKSSPKDGHPIARLSGIRERVHTALAGIDPGLFVIEGYSYGSRDSHAHSLGELGGTLRLWAWGMKWKVLVVPPSTLKKYVTDKGNADKPAMTLGVFKRWGFSALNDNEADAYALARLGEEYLRWQENAELVAVRVRKLFEQRSKPKKNQKTEPGFALQVWD